VTSRVRFVRSLVVCVASVLLLASVAQAQISGCPSSTADVTTWHNDNCRTGWQQHESILTTSNVQSGFGLIAQWTGTTQNPMGRVFAQPLAVSGLSQVQVSGGPICDYPCSLVLIGDENDMLWAYQGGSNSDVPVWSINLAAAVDGIAPIDCTTITVNFAPCENGVLGNSIGATGTGVVDETTNPSQPILYLAAVVDMSGIPTYFLYAINIIQGTVLQTIEITGTFFGQNPSNAELENQCTSDYPLNTGLEFNFNHIQRGGLLKFGNVVYVPFSPGDSEWENGWLFGYSYSTTSNTFTQTTEFATTPYGTGGGIWGSGAGPATDGTSIYSVTGNGTWDMVSGNSTPVDLGSTVMRLLPSGSSFSVADWYTPSDVNTYVPPGGSKYAGRCLNDTDLGSGGLMIFPDQFYTPPGQHEALSLSVVGDKESNLYVMNINNLGMFASNGGVNCGTTNNNCGNNVETIFTPVAQPQVDDQGYFGSGSYWRQTSGGTTNYFLYYAATSHTKTAAPYPIYQYTLQTGGSQGPILNSAAVPSQTPQGQLVLFCVYSPTSSVSSNGNASGAILWAIESTNSLNPNSGSAPSCDGTVGPAALHAFDASSMNQLYTSNAPSRIHQPGNATYPTPTVFQGRVYMGTWTEVDVFAPCASGPGGACLD
jgi:hypothetical protein